MGLQRSYGTDWNDVYPQAYGRIETTSRSKKGAFSFQLRVFKDKATSDAEQTGAPGMGSIAAERYIVENASDGTHTHFDDYFHLGVISVSGVNEVAQCYKYLKEQVTPWSSALDILE